MAKRSKITRDLRSPKYRQRIVPNRKKTKAKKACRSVTEIIKEMPLRRQKKIEERANTIVSNEFYDALVKILEEPVKKPSKKLIELMRSTPLWQKKSKARFRKIIAWTNN